DLALRIHVRVADEDRAGERVERVIAEVEGAEEVEREGDAGDELLVEADGEADAAPVELAALAGGGAAAVAVADVRVRREAVERGRSEERKLDADAAGSEIVLLAAGREADVEERAEVVVARGREVVFRAERDVPDPGHAVVVALLRREDGIERGPAEEVERGAEAAQRAAVHHGERRPADAHRYERQRYPDVEVRQEAVGCGEGDD